MPRSRSQSVAVLASFMLLTIASGSAAAWWCRSEIGDAAGPWAAAAWSGVAAFGTMLALVLVVGGVAEYSRMRSISAAARD